MAKFRFNNFRLNKFSGLLIGFLFSIGAPIGLVFVLGAFGLSNQVVYIYVSVSTFCAFGMFGFWLGYLYEKQKIIASSDVLTGLDYRHSFMEKSSRMLEFCARSKQPASLLYLDLDLDLDLDNFKKVNDESGHEAGDEALKKFAKILLDSCRGSDIAARLGGDEFVIFLPGSKKDGASVLGNRIRAALLDKIASKEKFHHLNVSIGVSEFTFSHPSVEGMLKTADFSMYEDKKSKKSR